MAQHKAAMERIFRDDVEANSPKLPHSSSDQEVEAAGTTTGEEDRALISNEDEHTPHHKHSNLGNHHGPLATFLAWLRKYSAFLMMPVLPIMWCILFLTIMDRQMLSSSYAMPLLGICSASLANAVPVGGGIVFVPVLALFGVQLHLGTAFAVATMTFGNGVFGFLSWLRKDPASIAWWVVPFAVFPAWIGATLGTLRPFLSTEQCRHLFGIFCVTVAMVVLRGIYQNQGINDSKGRPFSIVDNEHEFDNDIDNKRVPRQKILASCCSFLAGLVLVPHIGIGNAMTTFLVCTFVWRLPAKSSVVTGILVGGWTSFVPFIIHLFVIGDVPVALWVMGLPGVYLGARIAPLVHERLGITNVLIAFVVFLFGTAALMFFRPS